MGDFRQVLQCRATWNTEPSCSRRGDGWHECRWDYSMHGGPHLCLCGHQLAAPGRPLPEPDLPDPGIPERREKTPEQRYQDMVVGSLLLILVTLLLVLGTLVGILTAVLGG